MSAIFDAENFLVRKGVSLSNKSFGSSGILDQKRPHDAFIKRDVSKATRFLKEKTKRLELVALRTSQQRLSVNANSPGNTPSNSVGSTRGNRGSLKVCFEAEATQATQNLKIGQNPT